MASPIKNVLLIGASGNLGPAILKEFIDSPYTVTILSRLESKSTYPSDIKVVKSDYSPESLKSAFTGQDAVISIVADDALEVQQKIVDAAIAAGVKRFFPSEFGSDTASKEYVDYVPIVKSKSDLIEYLITKESQISWTAMITGPFFDWGLKVGFFDFDLTNKKAAIWDGGNTPFSASNVATIGKALVATLSAKSYEKTKNQYIYVASFQSLTQKEILASLEKASGSKWEVSTVDAESRYKEAIEKFSKGDFSVVLTLIQAHCLGKVGLGKLDKIWNDELGLPKEDLDEVVKEVLEGKRP